jgi:hypothetical protein
MSTRTLPDPPAMERQITREMPHRPHVTVTPRGKDGCKCPAWAADHYEVLMYPVVIWPSSVFDDIETAIWRWPGCVDVTQAKDMLQRPMVRALIADPPPTKRQQRGDTPHERGNTPHQRLSLISPGTGPADQRTRHRPGGSADPNPSPGEQIADSRQAGHSRSGDCGTRPPLWYM